MRIVRRAHWVTRRTNELAGHEAGKQENRKQEKDYEHNADKERIALADECLSAE